MRFEYTDSQTELERLIGGFVHFNAIGPIEAGDAAQFLDLIERVSPPPFAMVCIDSPGGDVNEAMMLGRAIRSKSLWTGVGTYILNHEQDDNFIVKRELISGRCLSSSTLMYLGGRFRFLSAGARFGVHQFRFGSSEIDILHQSQVTSARIASYLHELGVDPAFLSKTASVHYSEIENLEHKFLEEIGQLSA